MRMLLAFAPFIAFAVVERLSTPMAGLIAGAIVAAGLLTRDVLTPGRSLKILDIGTAVLFTSLAIYAVAYRPAWSVITVRLFVDVGLLFIVLTSLAIRRPFTLQFAREQVASEFHSSPEFLRTNYIITAVWALAFAIMVAAEAALLYTPSLPHQLGVGIIIISLVGAVKFTSWYPEHVRGSKRTLIGTP